MENTSMQDSLFEIGFNEQIKTEMKGAANWGGMFAIVSIIGTILSLVSFFTTRAKFKNTGFNSVQQRQIESMAFSGGLVSVVVSVIVGFIMFYLLNKFSRSVKKGLETNDHFFVNEGLGSLKGYFTFLGVILIILLVIFGLAMLIGLIGIASKGV